MKSFFPSVAFLCGATLLLFPQSVAAQRIINFDDLTLGPDSYWDGSDDTGGFTTGGLGFNNQYDRSDGWESWGGWSYSNINDPTTGGFGNQFASAAGLGLGSTGIYGVAYVDDFNPTFPTITLLENEFIQSIRVTNTTYAYMAMHTGDVAKKFESEDDDFFRLIITGLNTANTPVASIDFYLADFRHENSLDDYILNEWATVDLSTFGPDIRSIQFALESSDTGIWGMNTPAYFALGEVTVIPEPSAYALGGGLLAGLLLLVRRRGRREQTGRS